MLASCHGSGRVAAGARARTGAAAHGVRHVVAEFVAEFVADMNHDAEQIPVPLADCPNSGRCNVRVPEQLHRRLAIEAAEQGMSLSGWSATGSPEPSGLATCTSIHERARD